MFVLKYRGFVNFRATYTAGAERVYGAHCHAGDIVGVLLDCDAGRLSYFIDGIKYGEHILNDLGCAFENLSPFGFNADGCGSGGAGQVCFCTPFDLYWRIFHSNLQNSRYLLFRVHQVALMVVEVVATQPMALFVQKLYGQSSGCVIQMTG